MLRLSVPRRVRACAGASTQPGRPGRLWMAACGRAAAGTPALWTAAAPGRLLHVLGDADVKVATAPGGAVTVSTLFAGRPLSLEVGRIAPLASGAGASLRRVPVRVPLCLCVFLFVAQLRVTLFRCVSVSVSVSVCVGQCLRGTATPPCLSRRSRTGRQSPRASCPSWWTTGKRRLLAASSRPRLPVAKCPLRSGRGS